MWHLKKMLLSLSVLGALSCFTITGTFALLNSETRNNGGSISSGTLTFTNKVSTNTACASYGAGSTGNANPACDAMFSNATLMYPGTPATQNVTIRNDGSIDGGALSIYMPSCTVVATPGAPTPGGANPCGNGGAQIYIQEMDSTFTSVVGCVFPTTGGACTFVANTMSYLSSVKNSAASSVAIGGGPAVGASRYFRVAVQLPVAAGNALQGEEALFSLTWHLSS